MSHIAPVASRTYDRRHRTPQRRRRPIEGTRAGERIVFNPGESLRAGVENFACHLTTPRKLALMPRDMTPEEVRSFISHGTRTAKVATVMKDGHPHVMPVWFVLDREQIVFTTAANTVKGRNLRRDPRIALVVEDDEPPFTFVHVRGRVTIHEDIDELLWFATAIGSRYMGEDRAEEFGQRNAVPGELLVRVTPERIIAEADVAGY